MRVGVRLIAVAGELVLFLGFLAGCSSVPVPVGPATSDTPIVSTASKLTSVAPSPSAPPTPAVPSPDTRTGAALDQPYTVNGIIVVSKDHPISKNYVPVQTKPNGLTSETQQALDTMTAAAKADGIRLYVHSGYRSYAEQAAILQAKIKEYGDEALARRYNAAAGCSEHQTGLAVDLWDGVTWGNAFAKTKAAGWLWQHAREYGFILRYPPDNKEQITGYAYEPWHFRYVGVETSLQFEPNSTLTLEEFLGLA